MKKYETPDMVIDNFEDAGVLTDNKLGNQSYVPVGCTGDDGCPSNDCDDFDMGQG